MIVIIYLSFGQRRVEHSPEASPSFLQGFCNHPSVKMVCLHSVLLSEHCGCTGTQDLCMSLSSINCSLGRLSLDHGRASGWGPASLGPWESEEVPEPTAREVDGQNVRFLQHRHTASENVIKRAASVLWHTFPLRTYAANVYSTSLEKLME